MGSSDHKTLKEVAKDTLAKNPTALGDPVSLKAEKSDTQPTEKDKPNKSAEAEAERKRTGGTSEGKKSLAEAAMSNPTLLGDPVSLKAERSDSQITPDDRGARGVDKVRSKM